MSILAKISKPSEKWLEKNNVRLVEFRLPKKDEYYVSMSPGANILWFRLKRCQNGKYAKEKQWIVHRP